VISGQYVWQLRTGRRDNPTYRHLVALSRFFGVSPMCFFDEAETGRGALPAEEAVALRDDALRDLALRAAGLSEHSLKAISDLIDSARILPRLPGKVPNAGAAPRGLPYGSNCRHDGTCAVESRYSVFVPCSSNAISNP
jgi:hypothetical protein